MRIITVEEHFHHPQAIARVLELAGPGPVVPDDGFADFLRDFTPDQDSAERLAGHRLAHMDRVGIDVQVVSHGANSPGSLAHAEAVELCRRVNNDLAQQIAEFPARFRGFATLPLYDPIAAADELKRCVNELGFGALVAGSCAGLFLDDQRFDPVLAAAETANLPIYVHPGQPENPVSSAYYAGNWPAALHFMFAGPAFGWHAEAGIHILRLISSGALDRHPNLRLLSGHWGEFVAGWLDRLDETISWTGHRLQRQVSRYYREQVWVTPSGMYSQNQLNFIVAEISADRIIYSEDFPYVVRDNVSEFLEQADLTDDQRNAIAHGNAENIMPL